MEERYRSRFLLKLNSTVVSVNQKASAEVGVLLAQGNQTILIHAKQCVLATGVSASGLISFTPPLPDGKRALIDRMPSQSALKLHVVYPRPFWRETDFSVNVPISHSAAAADVMDVSNGGKGILSALTFVDDVESDELQINRKRGFLDFLTSRISWAGVTPGALQYVEREWLVASRFMRKNTMTTYGKHWRGSVGRVHWAGADVNPTWVGSMEGAVASGLRAANTVLPLVAQ
jgi:monoamine oxidase